MAENKRYYWLKLMDDFFDSKRIKKLLKLPHGAGINMVIPCGIRNGNKGIWGERGRVPFNEIYHRM